MKYLITGGAGFIGSHFSALLLEKGHEVIIVDDLSFGKLENIQLDKLTFIKDKVQNLALQDIEGVNGIIHLAAQPSVPLSIEDFYESSKNNLESSIKVIDFARTLGIPLVYASSSALYGNLPLGDDTIEKYDLESPYALDKLVLEQYCELSNKLYNLSSIGLRFFNVYGPRQDALNPYSGVISVFADRMLKGHGITVNGGYQTRDFIYIGDIVDTIYSALEAATKNIICDSLNVGTGISISINKLVEVLIDIIGFKPEIEYKDLPLGDPEKSEGVYGKLNKVLNIDENKFLKLEHGLIETVDFFKLKK